MKTLLFLLFASSILLVLLSIAFMEYKYGLKYFIGKSQHLDGIGNENATRFNRLSFERWIVITTVSKPTDDIKKMAAFKDWTIVVVADKKTPNNWSFPNCHFLSVEDQMLLGYDIVSLIPFNSYTRKMIGYLYAIENGAKFIYDTDDDNLPIKGKLDSFDYTNVSTSLVYRNQGKSSFFNVYANFGRPDIWPRGFPLEEINEEVKGSHFHLCSEIPTPTIQQGLVNQDADVDAVYRMIYVKNKAAGLKIEFDDVAPPVVIDKDTYVPFNSQNTLFHYGAFWALMLPTTVAFRVTDIWRGYFAQRLLHLSGQRLAFYGPNARQNRNPHNYYADYIDETLLYTQSSRMVNVLQSWTCPYQNFVDCISSLSKTMVQEDLWLDKDFQLTMAWLKDLQKVGYTFPEYQNQQLENCSNVGFVSNMQKNIPPFKMQLNSLKTLYKFCRSHFENESTMNFFTVPNESIQNHTKNVVLVVVFNHPHFSAIPLLQTIYDPWFANVIFCGAFPDDFDMIFKPNDFLPFDKNFSYISVSSSDINQGLFGYLCLTKVAEMGIGIADGFLVIGDDVQLNFWNGFDLSKVHSHTDCVVDNMKGWQWWSEEIGEKALFKVQAELKKTRNIKPELKDKLELVMMYALGCISDVYYVPQKKMKDFSMLSRLFFDSKVFQEIAIPKLLWVLGWSDRFKRMGDITKSVDLEGKYLWGQDRKNPFAYFNESSLFLHPLKLSYLRQKFWRSGFCNTFVVSLFDSVFKSLIGLVE